jgi:hypothetical protein
MIAERSYVFPSASRTGSYKISMVRGQRNPFGALRFLASSSMDSVKEHVDMVSSVSDAADGFDAAIAVPPL